VAGLKLHFGISKELSSLKKNVRFVDGETGYILDFQEDFRSKEEIKKVFIYCKDNKIFPNKTEKELQQEARKMF